MEAKASGRRKRRLGLALMHKAAYSKTFSWRNRAEMQVNPEYAPEISFELARMKDFYQGAGTIYKLIARVKAL